MSQQEGSVADSSLDAARESTSDGADVLAGWWRYPPAALAGLVTSPFGFVVVGTSQLVDGPLLTQLLVFLGTALLFVPVLALGLGSLLSYGSVYWGSKRYRADPSVEWDPNPTLYLVAAVLFTPLLVGAVWFVQRVRYVGTPDFATWI